MFKAVWDIAVCNSSPVLFFAFSERQSNPITDLDMARGFQEFGVLTFQDNRSMKVAGVSALRTGRLYPPGGIPGTHFC